MKNLVFIVNPKAGVQRVKEIQNAIEASIDRTRFHTEIVTTQYAKHGAELARKAAENGAYAVIAVGGDGSVNDVVDGLEGSDAILGILPLGSGNGLARTLNIPLELNNAMAVINQGKTLFMDVAMVNDRKFLSNAGVAFDALIAQVFASSDKRGFTTYSWLVLKHFWNYTVRNYQIEFDGKTINRDAFLVVVANAKQFGYNFSIAPTADLSDGLLNLIILKKFPKWAVAGVVNSAMKGRLHLNKYVEHYTVKEVNIHHPELTTLQTDGDAHPCAPNVYFRLKERKQQVFVP